MDHLEVYETYLQLEKEKKLATEEYKNIKFIEQETKVERQAESRMMKGQIDKVKVKKKEEENVMKKAQIQEFRKKKEEERQQMLKEVTK